MTDQVSGRKLRTILLLRDPARGWYCDSLGWVDDIHSASVVTTGLIDLLYQVAPEDAIDSTKWEVVKFVEVPF